MRRSWCCLPGDQRLSGREPQIGGDSLCLYKQLHVMRLRLEITVRGVDEREHVRLARGETAPRQFVEALRGFEQVRAHTLRLRPRERKLRMAAAQARKRVAPRDIKLRPRAQRFGPGLVHDAGVGVPQRNLDAQAHAGDVAPAAGENVTLAE